MVKGIQISKATWKVISKVKVDEDKADMESALIHTMQQNYQKQVEKEKEKMLTSKT